MLRKGLVGAALAVLALGSAAMADNAVSSPGATPTDSSPGINSNIPVDLARVAIDPVIYGDDQAASAPAAPAAEAAPPPAAEPDTAIMWGLDQVGAGKVMKDLELSFTGYVELGYFYDLTSPKDTQTDRSSPRDAIFFPGSYKNDIMLNQVDLAIQRKADVSDKLFDVGFMVEGIYGRDAVYTHSNGILDNGNKHGKTSPDDEVINPTGNLLYTHSYLFSYAVPLTQTGITATYNFTPNLKVIAGFTRGWNQSTSDNNGAIDFLGRVAWTSSDSKWTATLNFSEGPQSTGDNHDYWTVIDPIVSWQVSDQLTATGEVTYGDANAIAQWYGVAGYLSYVTCKYATVNFRAEFYHDGRGFTTGVGGTDINYIEGTLGVAITPLADVKVLDSLTFRPEVRLDTADHGVFDNTHFTELTMALDAYIKF
ncbi:MAG: outer membrane beta-barrel protein [Tepidisphaeraceae bacterium]